MRKPGPRIDKDRMPASRLHDRHAERDEPLPDISVGARAIGEIVLVDDLDEALRDSVEVASGEAAVGREAFGSG